MPPLTSNKEDMKKCPSQTGKCPERPPIKTAPIHHFLANKCLKYNWNMPPLLNLGKHFTSRNLKSVVSYYTIWSAKGFPF